MFAIRRQRREEIVRLYFDTFDALSVETNILSSMRGVFKFVKFSAMHTALLVREFGTIFRQRGW